MHDLVPPAVVQPHRQDQPAVIFRAFDRLINFIQQVGRDTLPLADMQDADALTDQLADLVDERIVKNLHQTFQLILQQRDRKSVV